MTISTKMKWINTIFIMLLFYSCNNENEKMSHSDLVDDDCISDIVNKDDVEEVTEENELKVILGSLQFKLEKKDPKVVYLNTLINPTKINKEVKSGKSDEAEYFATYLGQITLNEKDLHVFKQFYTIQAAIEKHGCSVIIFMDKQGASYYDMELPEYLPIDMKNGSFRFKHKNDTLLMKIEHLSENDLILRNTHNTQ
ncbi:hypothetical protein GCM10009118_27090 [Wandonia haliotis]|uniref:Uncharacterized protein n=2 Tax=Wandonia haliotis TaxID=574963 RepID=A0ABN1MT14_9FLAO